MKFENFQTVHESEMSDFIKECRELDIIPAEFQFTESNIETTPQGSGLTLVTGQVTVSRNSISRTYNSGHGHHWTADAIIDLRNGIFGD